MSIPGGRPGFMANEGEEEDAGGGTDEGVGFSPAAAGTKAGG